MKDLLLIALALVVPVFFLSVALSSAYHRRKQRQAESCKSATPGDT